MQGYKLGRDRISSYVRGKYLPRPEGLEAIAKALQCKASDLLPPGGVPSVGQAIFELKWSFEAWTEAWGKNPLPASDYHAKEAWKTLQEIAHMMAVDRLERDAS